MRCVVVGEYRLLRDRQGRYFAESVFGYDFWTRYLSVFDAVTVVARVSPVADATSLLPVEGPGVTVHPLSSYSGVRGYLRNRRRVRQELNDLVDSEFAYIVRVPGRLGDVMFRLVKGKAPVGVEVVGDPYDVFAPGVVAHPLRPLLRRTMSRSLRRMCADAQAVGYVSSVRLPERYPARPGAKVAFYSSASMSDDAYVGRPREYEAPLCRLVSVGSMAQRYKGFDVLLRALVEIRKVVSDTRLVIIGDGRYREELDELVEALGLRSAVVFMGHLHSPEEIWAVLDESDLYVSASRTEGLPRAVIEAMARGLACVSTDVGSTGELLPEEVLVPAGESRRLAQACLNVMTQPQRATLLAERNASVARRYKAESLQQQRDELFRHLVEIRQWCGDVT